MESYSHYSPPSDPGWPQQWSLVRVILQCYHSYLLLFKSDFSGADINVEPAWLQGVNGSGIIVAIVDNGKLPP